MAVRNPRGGLKPGQAQTDKTDFSFAYRYLEDRRIPKWTRIQVKYPYIEDRSAIARIPFESDELRRSFRNTVPKVPIDYNNLSTRPPEDLSMSKYLFHSDAPNASNVPEGFYGTSSGIFPIPDNPNFCFNNCTQTIDSVKINQENGSNITSSGEFFFVLVDNVYNKTTKIYSTFNNNVLFEWEFKGYDSPTEPKIRYPKGVFKNPHFKY